VQIGKSISRHYLESADILISNRFFRGGDHESFLADGFPAVRFTEPNEDFKHQHQDPRAENGTVYGDNIEFVDFDYTGRVGKVNLASMWSIANAPAVRYMQSLIRSSC